MSTADAPSGVVTFLFTDVEGSTRRWEADADAMRAALAAHDEVLRKAIEAHGGFLFKHTGDGVCAAFASPRSAVDTAVEAQQALELPVRMGLATGEAELRGADYFGAVMNRGARVMAAGHGGQILLGDSTARLLSGVDLLDLGSRRLRDVPTALGVFQVRAPGLRTDFPPLLTKCSVFAGGFNLQSACAISGSDDDFATLDLLDALVRKSLLVADRASGRTRFSMLETIRQFAEEQLVASGAAEEVRTAHARYFAGREADIFALWDSPNQRQAYEWFAVEIANLRTAFRWPPIATTSTLRPLPHTRH